jgi:hypothetical protein
LRPGQAPCRRADFDPVDTFAGRHTDCRLSPTPKPRLPAYGNPMGADFSGGTSPQRWSAGRGRRGRPDYRAYADGRQARHGAAAVPSEGAAAPEEASGRPGLLASIHLDERQDAVAVALAGWRFRTQDRRAHLGGLCDAKGDGRGLYCGSKRRRRPDPSRRSRSPRSRS